MKLNSMLRTCFRVLLFGFRDIITFIYISRGEYMKKVIFKGCGTALVTPFTNDGVNFEELRKLIEFQILEGADSLIICGTTGESSTMSLEEKKAVIEFSIKIANKRIPIIAGTGG